VSNEFERDVTEKLGMLEERTRGLPDLAADVADIKGRVRLLEFKSGMFGAAAGALIVGVRALFGKGQ